jgi:PAS domain S-box-containing protein
MTAPGPPFRCLIVEDRPADAELILHELGSAGVRVDPTVVDGEEGFRSALDASTDLVLADYSVPGFGALAALRILRERALDVPLVVVSGSISEEIAVECMRLGAADYLLKDRLGRLGVAARQAIERRDAERRRREIEAALLERDRQFRAVFENALDAIIIVDDERRLVDANPAASSLLGHSRDELLRLRVEDLFPTAYRETATSLWGRFIAEGEQHGEVSLLHADGSLRIADYRARASILPGRHLSVMRDISDRRRLEEQLTQSQKMEAVGRLAGGIAHDFNNLLTAISGYAHLLGTSLEGSDRRQDDVAAIVTAAESAARLTNQLLAFSRRQILQLRVVAPADVLTGMAPLIRRVIGEGLELTIEVDPETGHVRADPNQLEQVIVNLALNARDAMPLGGRLTLESRNVTQDASYAEAHADVAPGHYVLVAVSDTGVGMDSETLARIFEPFFTTKGPERGTGLGLATVYGIVKQSGGHVWVYSEPGRGTTFKVYLPRVDAPADPLPRPAPIGRPAGGSETILVVEDDDAVRGLVAASLKRAGYTVLAAASGRDALPIIERQPGPIHLLLTDIVLPAMSGQELAEHAQASRPDVRVLFMSGYTANAVVHHGVLEEGVNYLAKPFSPGELLSRVRALLDAQDAHG